jgi:type 1 glutamine amidotransferase
MKMNRGNLGAGLLVFGIIVLILVCFVTGVQNLFAVGSPKQLPAVSEEVAGKIEAAVPAAATARPAKARKILVFWLCKGYFHDSIPVANKAIEVMGKKTGAYDVVFSDDMNEFTAEKLAGFDAVLFNNTTKLEFNEPGQREALVDFVKGGKGIIGIHAATDNFYTWPEGAEMMGGLFAGHPWTAEGTWAIKNVEPNHPLNAAFKGEGFKINDEIYRVRPLKPMENRRVLLALDLDDPATKSAKGVRESDHDKPVSWVRDYGKGRVFYCGLGHNKEVFFQPAILRHYLDGIQFALGDLKVDASPVAEKAEQK